MLMQKINNDWRLHSHTFCETTKIKISLQMKCNEKKWRDMKRKIEKENFNSFASSYWQCRSASLVYDDVAKPKNTNKSHKLVCTIIPMQWQQCQAIINENIET